MKILNLIILFMLTACASSGSSGDALFAVGKCIERPWGAYTFKVAETTNNTYFLYKVGYMGKEIIKVPYEEVHKEFQEINCP